MPTIIPYGFSLPTGLSLPQITNDCGTGLTSGDRVAVFVFKGLRPLSGVNVKLKGTILSDLTLPQTDSGGITKTCSSRKSIFIYVQKNGEDFGSGLSTEHKIGGGFFYLSSSYPVIFIAQAKFCGGIISVPNIQNLLVEKSRTLPLGTPLTTLSVPISITTTGTSVAPVKIYINGKDIGSTFNNGSSFDLIASMNNLGIPFGTSITILIRSTIPDCDIPDVTQTVLTPKPTVPPPPVVIPCFGELNMNLNNVYDTLSKSPILPPSINVPVSITGITGDIGSKNISIFVSGIKVGSVSAGQSIDLIRVLSGRVPNIAVSNKITLVPESPCIKEKTFDIPPLIPTGIGVPPPPPLPTTCSDVKTTVDSVNHDSILPSIPSTPFFISINKIKLECPSNPTLTKKMTGETGIVTLGSLSAQFPIPSVGQSDGEVYFDLSKLIDLSKIIGGVPVIPPVIPPVTPPTLPPKPTGRFGGSVPAAIAYLNTYYPGKYLSVEPTSFGGGTAVKITRTNGSYFNAQSYEDINGYI